MATIKRVLERGLDDAGEDEAKMVAGLVTVILAATTAGCSPEQESSPEGLSTGSSPSEVRIRAEWPTFENVEEISQEADLVIEAQFNSSWEAQTTPTVDIEYDPPDGQLGSGDLPVTISSVLIVSVLKGDATPGSDLDVEGRHFVEQDTTLVADSETDSVVVFLTLPELVRTRWSTRRRACSSRTSMVRPRHSATSPGSR